MKGFSASPLPSERPRVRRRSFLEKSCFSRASQKARVLASSSTLTSLVSPPQSPGAARGARRRLRGEEVELADQNAALLLFGQKVDDCLGVLHFEEKVRELRFGLQFPRHERLFARNAFPAQFPAEEGQRRAVVFAEVGALQPPHLGQGPFPRRPLFAQEVEALSAEKAEEARAEAQRSGGALRFANAALLRKVLPKAHQKRVLSVEDKKVFERARLPQADQRRPLSLQRRADPRTQHLLEEALRKGVRPRGASARGFGRAPLARENVAEGEEVLFADEVCAVAVQVRVVEAQRLLLVSAQAPLEEHQALVRLGNHKGRPVFV